MKKILMLILLIFLVGCVKTGGEDMYIALYDRNLNHITNLTDVKYEYTRRVFDFDSSSFSGVSDKNILDAFIFVLCSNVGSQVYSGFVKSLNQENNFVTFHGEDLRAILDTEIMLNYTGHRYYYGWGGTLNREYAPSYLSGVFQSVVETVEDDVFIDYQLPIEFNYPKPVIATYWIANFDKSYLITNAIKFLKPYLAYYDYYISAAFNITDKKIVFEIVKNDNQKNIELSDFVNDYKFTNVTTNKTIARLTFQTLYENTKGWEVVFDEYRHPDPMDANGDFDILIEQSTSMYPEVDINDYEIGYKILIKYKTSDIIIRYIIYEVKDHKYVPMPSGLPEKHYYLGLDNNIYEESIVFENKIFPVKAKIFEDAFLAKAQFAAVNELVNSRYNENIILTNVNSPIDLSSLELYTMVNVYTKQNGIVNIKSLPVSEINNNNGVISVTLGFKKTKIVEIIKEIKSEPPIKQTGSSAVKGEEVSKETVNSMINNKVPSMIEGAVEDALDDIDLSVSIEDVPGLQEALNSKASSTHTHSAVDITSGTLPVERGGTGETTIASTKSKLGIPTFELSGTTLTITL